MRKKLMTTLLALTLCAALSPVFAAAGSAVSGAGDLSVRRSLPCSLIIAVRIFGKIRGASQNRIGIPFICIFGRGSIAVIGNGMIVLKVSIGKKVPNNKKIR